MLFENQIPGIGINGQHKFSVLPRAGKKHGSVIAKDSRQAWVMRVHEKLDVSVKKWQN